MIEKTLAILAGGKSSRMNYQNKALLTYHNDTFIERLIHAGEDFKEVIIIANNPKPYQNLNVRVIADFYPGHGPLSGIQAALHAAKTSHVLCVACDMPLVRKEVLNYLGQYPTGYDVLLPFYEERLQPLCAIYSKGILSDIEVALRNEEYRLQAFIKQLNYQILINMNNQTFLPTDFMNVNTPTDFKNLEVI